MGRVLIALAWLAVGGCVAAAPPATARPDRPAADVVADVLSLSGTREATQSFEAALRRVVTALSGAETFRDPHTVTHIVENAITAPRILSGLAAHLEAHFDRDRFDRLLAVLRQPLTRRMTAMEVAASAASSETIAGWKTAHATTADGRARFALARRIDAATGATEATMGILYAAGRGAIRALADGNTAPPPDRLRAGMARLEAETREETVSSLAYSYRDASLDEITRYAELLETDLGRWFSRLQGDAVVRVAETLSESAIRRLMQARRAPRV